VSCLAKYILLCFLKKKCFVVPIISFCQCAGLVGFGDPNIKSGFPKFEHKYRDFMLSISIVPSEYFKDGLLHGGTN
jgi:hypothetical protein